MGERLGDIPFVFLSLVLGLGLAAETLVKAYSFTGLVFAALCFAGAGLFALASNRPSAALTWAISALLTSALVLGLAERDGHPPHDLRSLIARLEVPLDSLVHFDGCVAEEVRRTGGDLLTVIELHGFRQEERWKRCRGKVLLRIQDNPLESSENSPTRISYGDRLRGWAEWNLPRNFRNPGSRDRVRYLARRGISLTGRVRSAKVLEVLPKDCGSAWQRTVISARESLSDSLLDPLRRVSPALSAVVSSILIGDSWELDNATREAFQNAGTYHVLVVSGLHVVWVAWVLYRIMRVSRMPDWIGHAAVAAGVTAYAALVGFQASVSRALTMLVLFIIGKMLFRTANSVNLLFATVFLILVVSPQWLNDVGFQLSVLSASAILLQAIPWITDSLRPVLDPVQCAGKPERLFFDSGAWARTGRRWRAKVELLAEVFEDRIRPGSGLALLGCARILARLLFHAGSMLAVSVTVQIWLGPFLAYQFNRLSWISPLANLLVVPLASLLLAAGAAGAVFVSIVPLHSWVFETLSWIGRLLMGATHWTSSFVGGWQRCPTPSVELVVVSIFGIGAGCLFRWKQTRAWCLASLLFLLLLANGVPQRDRSGTAASGVRLLRLTFLDVGQGDAIVIRFPDSRVWVLDAGGMREPAEEMPSAFDVGEAVVSRYLWALRIRQVDRLLLSHPHMDHAGGLPTLMRNFAVTELDFGEPSADPTLARILMASASRGLANRRLHAGIDRRIGQVRVRVLNPPLEARSRSINDNSLVLHLSYGHFTALLTGDLERNGELDVATRLPDQPLALLKVAHHGSRTATLDSFLDQTRPRWAVVSAGRNNPFGHPAHETLVRLVRRGARPLQTLDQGAIEIETDGQFYRLSSFVSGLLETGIL